jgi:hypothetical protein
MLAALVVRWVIPGTQGTFCWRVPSLIAIFVVCAATFDTRVGFLAVRLCVSVLLTSYTLWDVFTVRSRGFCVDNLILSDHCMSYC